MKKLEFNPYEYDDVEVICGCDGFCDDKNHHGICVWADGSGDYMCPNCKVVKVTKNGKYNYIVLTD